VKLVVFDIDGTLIHADGAGVRATYASLRSFYGIEGAPSDYSMAGKIDVQIVTELAAHAGLDAATIRDRLADYWLAYETVLLEELPKKPVIVLPGVTDLLLALAGRTDVVVGLLTGNVGAAARHKLEAGGIAFEQFRLGAYGHEGDMREALPAIAVGRARDLLGHEFHGKDIVIIGDTPADIACGESLGVRTIGVATGRFSVAQLQAAGADIVFPDLSDTDAVVAAIVEN
jgi:phosphoglycolate phosphatase-like HAD superfamily hydrolase